MISTVLWLLNNFIIFEEWCKCTGVSDPNPHPDPDPYHPYVFGTLGSASGSVSQRYGSPCLSTNAFYFMISVEERRKRVGDAWIKAPPGNVWEALTRVFIISLFNWNLTPSSQCFEQQQQEFFSSRQITPQNCQLLQNPRHKESLASEEQGQMCIKNKIVSFCYLQQKLTVEYDVRKKMCNRKKKMWNRARKRCIVHCIT